MRPTPQAPSPAIPITNTKSVTPQVGPAGSAGRTHPPQMHRPTAPRPRSVQRRKSETVFGGRPNERVDQRAHLRRVIRQPVGLAKPDEEDSKDQGKEHEAAVEPCFSKTECSSQASACRSQCPQRQPKTSKDPEFRQPDSPRPPPSEFSSPLTGIASRTVVPFSQRRMNFQRSPQASPRARACRAIRGDRFSAVSSAVTISLTRRLPKRRL